MLILWRRINLKMMPNDVFSFVKKKVNNSYLHFYSTIFWKASCLYSHWSEYLSTRLCNQNTRLVVISVKQVSANRVLALSLGKEASLWGLISTASWSRAKINMTRSQVPRGRVESQVSENCSLVITMALVKCSIGASSSRKVGS